MAVLHPSEPRTATPTAWVVEDIPAGTFRVNRAALVEEAVFQGELRAIFDRCWLYVGHASEIPQPGDFRARDVGTRPLVFWHGHDGVRRVFYNSCRHRGALVCRVPEGNAKTMSCFYHAWTYGSTGALTGLPGRVSHRRRRAVVGPLPGHAPRTPRPALRQIRRAADACLLATVADADARGMTRPDPSVSR